MRLIVALPVRPCPVCAMAAAKPLALVAVVAPAGKLCHGCRASVAKTLASRYGEGIYPSKEQFAARHGVSPESAAFAEHWARFCHALTVGLAQIARNQSVSGLYIMTRDGGIEALAVMRTLYGTRQVPIGAAIGDPRSSLRVPIELEGFAYPPELGLDPGRATELTLAELGRLVVATPSRLRKLVDDGNLSVDQKRHVERHGFDEVFVRSHAHDGRRSQPPEAYIFAIRPAHWYELAHNKKLDIVPLFQRGAAPTKAARHPEALDAPYFTRWESELARCVPEHIMERGVVEAVRYVYDQRPKGWIGLHIGLPYGLRRDHRLAQAVARLAQGCINGGDITYPSLAVR